MRDALRRPGGVQRMNPAFSVIVFTTLSGAGLGLWCWLGLRIAFGGPPGLYEGIGWAIGLLLAAGLVAAGLASSFLHLGKPARAWRAFSQWRTSWLSREGVLAVACFLAMGAVFLAGRSGMPPLALRLAAALLALLALATVYSTAMIYASLRPIPAWSHRLVVPAYLGFALLQGALLLPTFTGSALASGGLWWACVALAAALLAVKWRYWRDLDRGLAMPSRGAALGLPQRQAAVFERPHTEANFVTREMAFVVARRHARLLRGVAVALFALLPLALLVIAGIHAASAPWAWPLAAAIVLLGAVVERWLFFAEARHVVTLYY
ncbi:dimethyl sulfoxide reductase anchor subunit family protein [Thermomonas mangrovi]|uniref:dimethyl sulfoxide reductase anchor subunit family protein n=1 Tax=Thermomonas mangrovi TaxID=2993316 RepID=UPI002307F3A4|nr:DmsC/YnfH family molybdoenzyme membrane anchor subunit [Thermomonas mangrovi]